MNMEINSLQNALKQAYNLLKNCKEKFEQQLTLKEDIETSNYLDSSEFSKKYKFISHNTIRRIIKEENIKTVKIHGVMFFDPKHIFKCILLNKNKYVRNYNSMNSLMDVMPEIKNMVHEILENKV